MQLVLLALAGLEELVQYRVQIRHPFRQRPPFPQAGVQPEQRLGEALQAPQRQRRAAFHLVVGQDAVVQIPAAARQRIAQQQPVQAGPPSVFGGGGQLPGALDVGVDAPANPDLSNPAPDRLQVVLRQAESPAQRRRLQQTQHLRGVEPAAAQIQQREERLDQRVFDPHPLIGDAERDPPLARRTVEHRLDQRPVGRDIRRHHDRVRGPQVRTRLEQRQQPIVQHLDFAHRAVANVHLHRAIVRPQRQRRTVGSAPFAQMENVGLQDVQHVSAGRLGETVPLHARIGEQQIEKVPPLLAQRGQQRIADRQVRLVRVDLLAQPGEIALGPDIAPVFPTGIEQEQVDFRMPRQPGQQIQIRGRQRGHADDGDPLRQAAAVEIAAGQRCGELFLHPRPMRRPAPRQPPPQLGLPVIFLARLPFSDPVGPIDQILVETVGDAIGQLVAAKIVLAVAEIGSRRLEAGGLLQIPQQVHRAPNQRGLVEAGGRRQLAQHRPAHLPQKRGRKPPVQVGANAQPVGQAQRQPAGHAVALDHDDLSRQRRTQRSPQQLGQAVGQNFETVASMRVKHGPVRGRGKRRERPPR